VRGFPSWSISVKAAPTGSRFHIKTSISSAAERRGGSVDIISQPPAATVMPPKNASVRSGALMRR
jgi:hypothetical protein